MSKERHDLKNGSNNIKYLGEASFFNDIGSEMVTPILPFYVSALGGGGVAIGLLSGLKEGFSSLFKLFGGWFSDRIGKRRRVIFIGYFISLVFKFLLGVAGSWQQLSAFVSFERLGKSRDAPRDAIISASTKLKGRGFGIHRTMDTLGAILGSLVVLIFFWKFQFSFKAIMFMGAVISILSLFPLRFVKEPKVKPIKRGLFKGIKNLSSQLKYFIFVAGIFTLGNFGLYMFLLLRAEEITGNLVTSLGIYVLFNLVFAIFTIPFGNLSDKIGRKKVLVLGYILFLLVTLGFIYANSFWSLLVLFALYGLVLAITDSNHRALVADLSGEMRGTAHGFYYFIIGIVGIPAGIIAGVLWNISYQAMFGYLSSIAVISIILLSFIKKC